MRRGILVLIAPVLIGIGCRTVYAPNMQNVPLFTDGGQLRATISTTNYQVAYSIARHIGIMANGQYKVSEWSMPSLIDENKQDNFQNIKWVVEGGAGYFKSHGEGVLVTEVYAGGGWGGITFTKTSSDTLGLNTTLKETFSANMLKFFIQPNLGLTSQVFDVALSSRLVVLNFLNIYNYGYSQDDLAYYKLLNTDKNPHIFIEPAVTVRFGYRYVKFHMQFITSILVTAYSINHNPFNFNVGLHINISR